jgi:ribosomal protein S18 acetylase RimI-like enzyme
VIARARFEPPYTIAHAASSSRLEAVRRLFREYADSLGVDLGFQGFDEELATLPGRYAPPDGRLLIALDGARAAGCIAVRRFDPVTGEVKRLYVRPAARGRGLGRALAREVIEAGREIGYRRLVLDTLEPMAEARELYRSFGFREIAAYYPNPLPGAIYMELAL